MRFFSVAAAAAATCASSVSAGTVIWDGRFNSMKSSADLGTWSWSNQVGPYQYYIHGPSSISSYINLSPSYKNPADTGSSQGAKFTLDGTSFWNGQTMRRTELIPQTTAAINKGKVFYHFSIMKGMGGKNQPSIYREHQICFFESHFTELKSGWISGAAGNSDTALRWDVGGQSKWSVTWADGVWHNVAYEIDFSANTVAFWHSTGSDPLTLTVPAVASSTSSNGADWHLGVLELPVGGQPDSTEDFYFSGVYIETGTITTSVVSPGGAVGSSSGSGSGSSAPSSVAADPAPATTLVTSAVVSTPVASAAPAPVAGTIPKYGQCGGIGWGGSGACVEGATCMVTNAYYSQCM